MSFNILGLMDGLRLEQKILTVMVQPINMETDLYLVMVPCIKWN